MNPYFNLRYSNSKIVIDYYVSKFISGVYRSAGITYTLKNLKEAKEYILNFIKPSSPEDKIIIKSRLRSRIGKSASKYSQIEKSNLEEITNFLNEKQKNITFKLAT